MIEPPPPVWSGLDLAVVEALEAAIVITDLTGRIFLWNRAAERLYGYRREDMLGASVVDLFVGPDDRNAAGEIMERVLAGQSWSGDFSVRCAGGTTKLVRITDSPLIQDGNIVGVVGHADDISEERFREARAVDRETQLRLALEAAHLGTWHWDRTTGTVTWDERQEAIWGLPPGGFDGTFQTYAGMLHPDDRDGVLEKVAEAVAAGTEYEVRHRVVWPDGTVHWVEGVGQATFGPDGAPTGTIGCCRDVTARVRVEQRLERLQALAADLVAATTIDQVAAIALEHGRGAAGAATAGVTVPSPKRKSLRWAAAQGTLDVLAREWPRVPIDAALPLTDAARTESPVYVASAADALAHYPDLAPWLPRTGSEAIACLPMTGGSGDVVGVLVLGCAEEREFDEEERSLLEVIAQQCGVAFERARLAEDTRRVAERLQADLAPYEVSAVPGFDIGAAYRPGGTAAEQIGGDWYDVLPQADGRVALVLGDVMGRGVDAASTMTRLRSAIRAFASVDASPDVMFTKVDRFVSHDSPDELVTIVYAFASPTTGGVSIGSAGHPPAVVLRTGDEPRLLEIADSPPLGLATSERALRTLTLKPDDVLLLTSDGLLDRRGVDPLEALHAVAGEAAAFAAAGMSAGDIARRIATRDGGDPPDDDVTVVVVRRLAH